MKVHINVPHFGEKDLILRFAKYCNNDRLAMALFEEDGDPFHTVTVNMVDESLPEGHVFLKGWSEGEGWPEAMEEAGLVELTGRCTFVGAEEAKIICPVEIEE